MRRTSEYHPLYSVEGKVDGAPSVDIFAVVVFLLFFPFFLAPRRVFLLAVFVLARERGFVWRERAFKAARFVFVIRRMPNWPAVSH